jgi:disulfide bond formation protein DsbB
MRATLQNMTRDEPIAVAAIAVALGGMATILGAWFFEYALKYEPCPLCLEQRIAYYVAIPLAVVVAAAALARLPRKFLVGGLAIIAVAMLWNAGLGIYHAGVEWKWWAGPQECAGGLGDLGAIGDLLKRAETARVVRCDEAAWRFLGLSLAGWNVVISLALAAVALAGALASMRQGSSSVSQ